MCIIYFSQNSILYAFNYFLMFSAKRFMTMCEYSK